LTSFKFVFRFFLVLPFLRPCVCARVRPREQDTFSHPSLDNIYCICGNKPFTTISTFPKLRSPCRGDDACVRPQTRKLSVPHQAASTQFPSTIVPTLDTRENQSPTLRTMPGLTTSISSSYSTFCIVAEYLRFVCLTSFSLSLLMYLKPRVPPVIIIVPSHL
jgi:hypothetical protein